MKTFKKLAILFTILTLSLGSVSLSFANQDNHGQYVSEVARSTEPGPEHGKIVSEAARNKSQNSHALSFDGVDDFVIASNNSRLNFIDRIATLEFWINIPAGQTQYTYLMNKHYAASENWDGGNDFNIGVGDGKIDIHFPHRNDIFHLYDNYDMFLQSKTHINDGN